MVIYLVTSYLVSKMRTLNEHKFGSSRNCLRLHIVSRRYENTRGVMRISKKFSTVLIIYRDFLRVVIIIQGPRTKFKSVVSNNNLKKIDLNKPKSYH